MKKRPERKLYIAPALRSKYNTDWDDDDEMEYVKDKYASEATNGQAYSLGSIASSQRSTNTVPRRVRSESFSSSNPRSISNESWKDDDSTDLEECCFVSNEATSDEDIILVKNENNSDDHWNTERGGKVKGNKHDIETENYHTNTKVSNRIFNLDDDSISEIEALIDSHTKKGRLLTSTPNSDVEDQNVLAAAVPDDESGMESTLLAENETMISSNRNKYDIKDPLTEFLEIFGNNYIPPPVPLPTSSFRLPPIHRLPLPPIPSSQELSVPRHVLPQKRTQTLTIPRHPRIVVPSPLKLYSRLPKSSHMILVPRFVSAPCLQPALPRAPNTPRLPSSMQPTLLPQERSHSPRSPQVASNPIHFHQRSLSPRNLESYKQDDSLYIPPPVPPPQQMDRRQEIRNPNQGENAQSCLPYSNSLVNKII